MKIFICFVTFISIFLSASTKAFEKEDSEHTEENAEEELASTQPYDPALDEELIQCLTGPELTQDLLTKDTVRYQIASLLKAQGIKEQELLTLLTHPVICVGTGKRRAGLKLKHIRPTYVRDQDFTIDFALAIAPDLIGDAFSIQDYQLPEHRGVVFFAHVGFGLIDNKPKTLETLKAYLNALVSGGYFIYISEIPCDPNHISKAYDRNGSVWVSQLGAAGFKNVVVFIRDESACYGGRAQSLVVIAKK